MDWTNVLQLIIAGAIVSGIIGTTVHFLRRQDYAALALMAKQLNENKPAQDTIEKALTGVVSVEVLQQVQQGFQAVTNQLMGIVSAQQDLVRFIAEGQKFVTAVTDGQPNVVPPDGGTLQGTTIQGVFVPADSALVRSPTSITINPWIPTSGQGSSSASIQQPIEPGAVG